MKTLYEEIVDVMVIGDTANTRDKNVILVAAAGEGLSPAIRNAERVLLLAIDMQQDFMPDGSLGVPGANGDVERATRFIYDNMDAITQIAVSLDTHIPTQIFHPCWWVDENGNAPSPYTLITLADLDAGKWMPVIKPKASRAYVEGLAALGKKQLMVWPYHCLQGTTGAALENQFANMVYFHSVAKKSVPLRLVKGQDPLSEMYGIIKPEFDTKGFINIDFLNSVEIYDKVVIVGEAKSHCVLESIKQILDHYAGQPDVTKKIYILEDCMSTIPGCEADTEAAFEQFKKQHFVNIVKSTDLRL